MRRLELQVRSLRYPVKAQHESPVSILRDAAGVFVPREQMGSREQRLPAGRKAEEEGLPISALLARIRRLVPGSGDRHYDEIVRSFGVGALRPPPMSDGELARAIAEFLREQPSSESVATLGRRLDPSSRL